MLAFAWPWDEGTRDPQRKLAERLGASLCAGLGGHAAVAEIDGLHFAYRPLRPTALARAWRPAVLPDGRIVAFHGYFDNAADIAAQLDTDPDKTAQLYGLAVDRWGDEAERRIIGEYCAIIADPGNRRLRLSRSPLRAPPLFYFRDGHLAAAASVPRALFAAGVEQKLNEDHVVDSALMNFADQEVSWFEGVSRVPVGHVVELLPREARVLRKTYDLLQVPDVRMKSDAEYIARAKELLDEGVRACMAGFARPGATLSGGLDSPQVAVRALAALPAGQRLPTFTFHPEEGFDGRVQPGFLGDERALVEAFVAMHPGIDAHFTANEGYEHDYRWNEFFHLMGGAPAGLSNMYVFHGLFSGAAKAGCDVLLLAEWGNFTFSAKGEWGFVEYLLKGKWRQLWRALARSRTDNRSVFTRFLVRTLSAFLPTPIWRLGKRFGSLKGQFAVDLMQPLSGKYRASSGGNRRLDRSGIVIDRYQPWNARQAIGIIFRNGDGETAEIYQAFEQMYGVAQRDPVAYRPFVEFCIGLPTEMFMRDGIVRWMAKEMAKGIMPEEQRDNRLNGRWDSDWHLRIGRRRKDFLAELDRLAQDERMAAMLDLPRLRSALEDWPEKTPTDLLTVYNQEFAVARGLLTARFINYVEGRNTG